MNPMDHKYPDTEAGAVQALGALSDFDMALVTKTEPDSYIAGVWMVEVDGFTCIVYLAGYNDRTTNDFEVGD